MQPPSRTLTMLAPMGGINRREGYQKQPPFTCVDVENWWPINYRTGRSVMATRPRRKVLDSPAGGGTLTVNMAERVNGDSSVVGPEEGVIVAENGQVYYWNGSGWTAATGAQAGSVATTGSVAAQVFLKKVLIQNSGGKPYVFDYDDGTVVTMTETAGTVPDGLDIFAVWQGAVWAAGAPTSPNVLYASRIGDALDWDFSVGTADTGGAFFTAGEDQGLLRGNITAIIPHSTDTLLVGTTEGIVALYGHPRKGGIIEDFSSRRIVGPRAWCKGPDDTTYIVTEEGLVAVPPGGQVGVVPVSQSRLPGALSTSVTAINTSLGAITTIAYDRAFNGLHMYTASGSGFWYDINSQGFWRMSFPSNVRGMLEDPPIMQDIDGTTLVYGDAGMQVFDDTLEATESFSATCFIGPVKIASSVLDRAMVTQARIVMDVAGSNVSLSLAAGTSGQDTYNKSQTGDSQYTRTVSISTNVNHHFYPRITGSAVVARLHVASVSRVPTIFEELSLGIGFRGRNRGSSQPPPLGI